MRPFWAGLGEGAYTGMYERIEECSMLRYGVHGSTPDGVLLLFALFAASAMPGRALCTSLDEGPRFRSPLSAVRPDSSDSRKRNLSRGVHGCSQHACLDRAAKFSPLVDWIPDFAPPGPSPHRSRHPLPWRCLVRWSVLCWVFRGYRFYGTPLVSPVINCFFHLARPISRRCLNHIVGFE